MSGVLKLYWGVVEKDACMLTDNKIQPFCLDILLLFKTWGKIAALTISII